MEVGGREPTTVSPPYGCILTLSGVSPAPAAAIVCGLNGLEEALATLPSRECCIPCTIEVCLWCPYDTADFESTFDSNKPPAASRDPAKCMREAAEGDCDCDCNCAEGIVIRPPDCSLSNDDSRECAMYRAVCGSNSPGLTVLSQSSSSSCIGDRGENFKAS